MTATQTVPNVLVTTDWVAQHAKDASVRIVEVDVDTTAYDQGHVPGAAGWNWTTELCDTLVRDIVPEGQARRAARHDPASTTRPTIVLYGDNNNWFAAWAFWQLKIYGHEDVRIMDGGRKKWLAEGRELSTEKPSFSAEDVQGQAIPTSRCARFCRKCRRPCRRRAPRSSTCAARRNSPARSSRLPDCPKPASAAGTFPAPRASPGRRRATTTGRSRASRS